MKRTAHGWAIADDNQILVKTVSATRQAAMVNWLVTERSIFVQSDWSFDQIIACFESERSQTDFVVKVAIQEL